MKHLTILILFSILYSLFSILPSDAKKQETSLSFLYYEQAVSYHKQGDLENANLHLNNALKLYPNDIPSLIEIGEVYLEQAKSEQAIKYLKRASLISPDDTLIHVLLGIAYLENKQHKESISEFRAAEKLEPDNILLKANLGLACSLIGDHKCSIDNLGKVVLAYPFQLRSRAVLGTAYHSMKDYGLAKEQYKFVLNYEPDNVVLWHNLAKTQIALGELDSAKDSLNMAIDIDSSTVEFYLDRAQVNYKLNAFKEAENDYILAVAIDPGNPEIPVEYAIFLWKTKDYLKAAELFEKAHELSQDDKSLIINKAYMYQLAKKNKEALKTWLDVLENEHGNKIALFNIGRLYQENEDFENAISFYKKLLLLGDDEKDSDIETRSGLAYCYQKSKNFDEAKALYNNILEKEPEDVTTIYNLGVLFLEQKDYKSALSYLEQAKSKRFTPTTKIYQALVEIYTNTNDLSNLKTTYKNWLEIDKDNVDARIGYARYLAKEGDSLGAIDQYRVAAALDNSSKSKLKLAEFLVEQKDLYGAIGQLQEYLKYEQNDLHALILLANAFKDLGIQEQAINIYKKIVTLQYDNNLAYYNLGLLFQEDKRYEEAQNYFLKSIEINDKYAPAYYALGISFLVANQNEKAKEYFQKYLQVEPNGEYREKVELKLKDLNNSSVTSKPEA